MTTVTALRKEVHELRERVMPKPPKDVVLNFSFGPDCEPHGRYGLRKLHLLTGQMEPWSTEEEVATLRDYYETQLPWPVKKWRYDTFEKWLADHECHCGRSHPYSDTNYRDRTRE